MPYYSAQISKTSERIMDLERAIKQGRANEALLLCAAAQADLSELDKARLTLRYLLDTAQLREEKQTA